MAQLTDDQVRKLAMKTGWRVDPVNLYDEEGIEGWVWSHDDCPSDIAVVGDWNEEPAVDAELHEAVMNLAIVRLLENGKLEEPETPPNFVETEFSVVVKYDANEMKADDIAAFIEYRFDMGMDNGDLPFVDQISPVTFR